MAVTHSSDRAHRLTGVIVGILVFLAGIALIGYVFATAHTMFDAPPPVLPASAFATPTPAVVTAATPATTAAATAAASTVPPAVRIIGQNLATFIEKLLVLLLMCIVGSVVASKGIDLFFKALAAPRAVPVDGAAKSS